MRARNGILLREIAGEHILVPIGENSGDIMGIMTLNDSGVILWKKLLQADCTAENLVDVLLDEYAVSRAVASADVDVFLDMLRTAKLLE